MKSVKILAVLLAVSVAGVAGAAPSKNLSDITVKVKQTQNQTQLPTTKLSVEGTEPTSAIFKCTSATSSLTKAPVTVHVTYDPTAISCVAGTLAGSMEQQQTSKGEAGNAGQTAVGILTCKGTGSVSITGMDCSANPSSSSRTQVVNSSAGTF